MILRIIKKQILKYCWECYTGRNIANLNWKEHKRTKWTTSHKTPKLYRQETGWFIQWQTHVLLDSKGKTSQRAVPQTGSRGCPQALRLGGVGAAWCPRRWGRAALLPFPLLPLLNRSVCECGAIPAPFTLGSGLLFFPRFQLHGHTDGGEILPRCGLLPSDLNYSRLRFKILCRFRTLNWSFKN